MEEIYQFLKEAGVYWLATLDGDQPRLRPFGTIDLFEGKLHIQTGKVKAVSSQMKANPRVEIAAMRGGDWIRITCEAVLDNSLESQRHMLDAYPSLQAMYQPGDGNTEIYALRNGTAQIITVASVARTIEF